MRAFRDGHYEEAENLFADSLRQAADFGEQDPRLGSTLFNLGQSFAAEGKYAEAEPFLRRSLAVRKSIPGPIGPDVARIFISLAETCKNEGKYAEAESIYQQAVQVSETSLNPNYQYADIALSSLAILYREEGRFSEAGSVFRQVLSTQKTFKEESP